MTDAKILRRIKELEDQVLYLNGQMAVVLDMLGKQTAQRKLTQHVAEQCEGAFDKVDIRFGQGYL